MAKNEDWPVGGKPCNDPQMHKIKALQGNADRQHDIGDLTKHSGDRTVRIGAGDPHIGTPRETGTRRVGQDRQVILEGRTEHIGGSRREHGGSRRR